MGQIKIISPGLMTTVRDLGRYGYQQYGVSVSGAMDYVAAKLANILSGNNENEGLLEITLMGPKIEFLSDTVTAIRGGDMEPLINDMLCCKFLSLTASVRSASTPFVLPLP